MKRLVFGCIVVGGLLGLVVGLYLPAILADGWAV